MDFSTAKQKFLPRCTKPIECAAHPSFQSHFGFKTAAAKPWFGNTLCFDCFPTYAYDFPLNFILQIVASPRVREYFHVLERHMPDRTLILPPTAQCATSCRASASLAWRADEVTSRTPPHLCSSREEKVQWLSLSLLWSQLTNLLLCFLQVCKHSRTYLCENQANSLNDVCSGGPKPKQKKNSPLLWMPFWYSSPCCSRSAAIVAAVNLPSLTSQPYCCFSRLFECNRDDAAECWESIVVFRGATPIMAVLTQQQRISLNVLVRGELDIFTPYFLPAKTKSLCYHKSPLSLAQKKTTYSLCRRALEPQRAGHAARNNLSTWRFWDLAFGVFTPSLLALEFDLCLDCIFTWFGWFHVAPNWCAVCLRCFPFGRNICYECYHSFFIHPLPEALPQAHWVVMLSLLLLFYNQLEMMQQLYKHLSCSVIRSIPTIHLGITLVQTGKNVFSPATNRIHLQVEVLKILK